MRYLISVLAVVCMASVAIPNAKVDKVSPAQQKLTTQSGLQPPNGRGLAPDFNLNMRVARMSNWPTSRAKWF